MGEVSHIGRSDFLNSHVSSRPPRSRFRGIDENHTLVAARDLRQLRCKLMQLYDFNFIV